MAEEEHSARSYFLVFLALMALLVVSVAVAYVDLGRWNLAVALAISTAKATLVGLYFMHLLHSRHLVPAIAVSGLLWIGILFSLAFADYVKRPQPGERQSSPADHSTTHQPRAEQAPARAAV